MRAGFTGIPLPIWENNFPLAENIRLIGNLISEPVYAAHPFWIRLYTAVHTAFAWPERNLLFLGNYRHDPNGHPLATFVLTHSVAGIKQNHLKGEDSNER